MSALTLNGIPIPVALGSWRQEVLGADLESTLARGVRVVGRTKKRRWRGTVVPRSLDEAVALRGLLSGAGQHFPLDSDAYSDAGLGASLFTGATFGGPGSLANHGQFIQTDGFGAEVRWLVQPTTAWTLIASLYLATTYAGHSWKRYIATPGGGTWIDGVSRPGEDRRTLLLDTTTGRLSLIPKMWGGSAWGASQARSVGSITQGTVSPGNTYAYECTVAGTTGATAPIWPTGYLSTVTDGTVTWKNIGERYGYAGDLAFLPYTVPDAWKPSINAFHTANPWSALPKLVASGDLLGGASVSVIGVDEEGEGLVGNVGAGRQQLERFSFTLQEV